IARGRGRTRTFPAGFAADRAELCRNFRSESSGQAKFRDGSNDVGWHANCSFRDRLGTRLSMITGYGLPSILGQGLQTPDSSGAVAAGAPDPSFASYLGNPPPPVPFEIQKADFESVFTALGGTQSQADVVFARLDTDGDGAID